MKNRSCFFALNNLGLSFSRSEVVIKSHQMDLGFFALNNLGILFSRSEVLIKSHQIDLVLLH